MCPSAGGGIGGTCITVASQAAALDSDRAGCNVCSSLTCAQVRIVAALLFNEMPIDFLPGSNRCVRHLPAQMLSWNGS